MQKAALGRLFCFCRAWREALRPGNKKAWTM